MCHPSSLEPHQSTHHPSQTLPNVMVLAANPYTVVPFPTKISDGHSMPRVSFVWPIRVPTLTALSSSSLCVNALISTVSGTAHLLPSRSLTCRTGKHVVFGRVIRGYDVVQKIAEVPTDAKDRPNVPITIVNCGELILKSKVQAQPERMFHSTVALACTEVNATAKSTSPVSDSEDDDGSEEERRRSKKKRTHHRTEDSASDRGPLCEDESDGEKRHRKKSKHKHRSKDKDKSRSKHKHKKDKERSPSRPRTPSAPVPPEEETEEQYDARLEREEKERLEELKRRELERLRRQLEEKEARESNNGVRFKGA